MKLSPNMRKLLVSEIRLAADNMSASKNILEKIYFFSAVYGIFNRVMNIEFDPELNFIHQVTGSSYSLMSNSMMAIKSGQMVNTFGENLFSKLEDSLKQLANNIEKDEPTYISLHEIVNLSYSTSGNGHYLVLKGKISV